MMTVKTRIIEADIPTSLPTPDGSSLEEKLNVFLATLNSKDVLDVIQHSFSSAKYGLRKTYTATVVYLV